MSLLNVNRILHNPRFTQQVPLIRRIIMEDTYGDETNEYVLPVEITAVVHPTGANDLERLPEGERYLPSKKIFSQEALAMGDIFIYQGKHWRIINLSDWSEYGFYNAIGILYEGTQGITPNEFKLR